MEFFIGIAALCAFVFFFMANPLMAAQEVRQSQKKLTDLRAGNKEAMDDLVQNGINRSFTMTHQRVLRHQNWCMEAMSMLELGHFAMLSIHMRKLPEIIEGCTKESLRDTYSILNVMESIDYSPLKEEIRNARIKIQSCNITKD